jgi:hypothetical protein
MGDLPVFVAVAPALVVALLLLWAVLGRRMVRATDGRCADHRLAAVAQRLGLRIVEGNPELDLFQAQATHDMAAGQLTGGRIARFMGDREKETRARLEGAPYGRPTQLVFRSYTKYQDRVPVGMVTSDVEFRLSVELPVEIPPFEIVLRKAGAFGVKARPEWHLPRQSFGDPEVDARLVLRCPDPRLGPRLSPVVGGLASHGYVHIQGQGRVISSLAEEDATMHAAFDLEQTQVVLEHMANALAGPLTRR